MNVLNRLAKSSEKQQKQKYRKLLRYTNYTAISFELNNGLYCIITPCAKQSGRFQLTYFDDLGPLSDSIRNTKQELFKELATESSKFKLKELM